MPARAPGGDAAALLPVAELQRDRALAALSAATREIADLEARLAALRAAPPAPMDACPVTARAADLRILGRHREAARLRAMIAQRTAAAAPLRAAAARAVGRHQALTELGVTPPRR